MLVVDEVHGGQQQIHGNFGLLDPAVDLAHQDVTVGADHDQPTGHRLDVHQRPGLGCVGQA
ncbi:hypothetical protein D3C84_731610 [compost metagenome]